STTFPYTTLFRSRIDDQLQALGHESALLVAEFLQRQRADILYHGVAEAGDFLDAAGSTSLGHFATQRENSEVESFRPADFSTITNSPDSTRPPMPANVSRIRACVAKNEARIE